MGLKHAQGWVDSAAYYGYGAMIGDLMRLRRHYPFLRWGNAGYSVYGRCIPYLRLGIGPHRVFFNGAHHGMEWITAALLMRFAENYLSACVSGRLLGGFHAGELWNRASLYIMPMVNPDGVVLATEGPEAFGEEAGHLLKLNGGNPDFRTCWQANGRGVDLNHNYPARWEESKHLENAFGIQGPGPTRFFGPRPLSEPETQAVHRFTLLNGFHLVLAYHSQGKVIYWDFDGLRLPEGQQIGSLFARLSGYTLDSPEGIASFGGYKDWFILHYRRPGFTIEAGEGVNPLPLTQLDEIYGQNEGILLTAAALQLYA